jgi:hypothetical protein
MEAHGSPGTAFAQRVTAHLPDAVTEPLMKRPGSIGWPRSTRRSRPYAGAEPSRLSGVYGGIADPMPMMSLFDKQISSPDGSGLCEALDPRHHALPDRR